MDHHLTQTEVESTTSNIHAQLTALMERAGKVSFSSFTPFNYYLHVEHCIDHFNVIASGC